MPEIVVYSRPGCMFCVQVEDLLDGAGIRYRPLEIVSREEQDQLMARHDARSFPVVLVDGKYLGGFTHIVKLHSEGRLAQLGQDASEPPKDDAPTSTPGPRESGTQSVARASTLSDLAKLGEYLNRKGG
ncbi:MAG TPA: glutaredoxin domain-containing protein [Polyangiaceae bacterium]